MPTNQWKLHIDLDDLWSDPENPLLGRVDELAARLRASQWPTMTTDQARLERLINGLATDDDPERWWQGLYDLADHDRVWLDTDGVERRRWEREKAAAAG